LFGVAGVFCGPAAAQTAPPGAVAQSAPAASATVSNNDATRKGDAAYKRKDYATALIWYRQAADQDDAAAQAALGHMYLFGEGVAKDGHLAGQLMRKAAEKNNLLALKTLAAAYIGADSSPEDYATAMMWMRKAADQDDAEAETQVGVMYHDGQGVAPNAAEAAKWLRKAADQGDALAQLLLGDLYANGDGVAQNGDEALRWWRKAADNGNARAKGKLEEIRKQEVAGAPSALQFRCYFMTFAGGDKKQQLVDASIQTFKSPQYRACIEENLKKLGLLAR
jgi:TPR repeat protein